MDKIKVLFRWIEFRIGDEVGKNISICNLSYKSLYKVIKEARKGCGVFI
jgi:hypothetical protein